ncbi:MAG TPA: EamA family transporter [Sideroxyarcus sp.]|nr:EamA family transporter [Sideroxyarcus sp.]
MPDSISRKRWLLPLALVVLTLTWGYSWVFAKQALSYAPPFAFAAERCVGAALVLMLLVKLTGRSFRLPAPGVTLAISLAQISAFMAFSNWALVEGGPGKTAVLIFTMPIWTLLLAWPLLGERVRGRQWLAAASTLLGLLLIIEPWTMHTSLFSKFLGVIAAMCWAVGTVLVKRLRSKQQVDLLELTMWQCIIGAVPLTLLAMLVPERATDWNIHYIGLLAFMAIVSTALCWWLWIYILDKVPAWEASLSVLGTPVVALISSRLVMGEEFRLAEMAGIALIGSGLAMLSLFGWLVSRKQKRS